MEGTDTIVMDRRPDIPSPDRQQRPDSGPDSVTDGVSNDETASYQTVANNAPRRQPPCD